MIRLDERKIVVTGAARGIGYAITKSCLEKGASVVMVDLSIDDLTSAKEKLGNPEKVFLKACDVSNEGMVKEMMNEIKSELGGIDALVNNAGITRDNLFMRMTLDQWQSVLNVNLTGSYLMARHGVGMLRKSSAGRIVNLSSVAARGNAGQANYSASKSGVIGFTRTLALELARYGVTVNAIAPGFIETEMTAAISDKAKEDWMRNIPAGRAGTPDDVADAVTFLLSDAAAYITGTVIGVDGGLGI